MTLLSLYKLLFTTELLFAEGLFLLRMPRRKHFVWRLLGGVAACYLLTALYPLFDGNYNGWYVSLMFLVLFAVTFGTVCLCFKMPLKNAFFCCLAAYTAQHLSYEIFKLVMMPFSFFSAKDMYGSALIDLTRLDMTTVVFALVYVDIYIAVYVASYFILGKKIGRIGDDLHIKNANMLLFSSVILLVDIILNAFTVYITESYNLWYDVIIGVYNSLCCVLVFYIQLSIVNAKDMRDELATVSELLNQAQRQYEMRREEIDLINIKCHDLKHRIAGRLESLGEDEVREIEEMISIYDLNIETGNKVVDIILTEKSLVCHSKQISLTTMADCSALGFVGDGDLYALFGNIVDNAVEAVSQVKDPDKKGISLNVREQSGCISIMSENYFEGELKISDNGLPQTTKRDTDYHGFGLKSVKAVAEKYGGSVSVVCEDDTFRINVLLPIPSEGQKRDK